MCLSRVKKLETKQLDTDGLYINGLVLKNGSLSSLDYLEEENVRDFEIIFPVCLLSVRKKTYKYPVLVKKKYYILKKIKERN